MAGNVQVVRIRQLTSNCYRLAAGVGGVICLGYDWPGIESICRMSGIKTNRHIIDRLRKLEDLDIKYLNQKEAAANG